MYELFKRAVDTVKNMPPNLRFGLSVAAILVLGGTILIYSWARHINYSVLYSGLPPEEVGSVVNELDRMKVPYHLTGDGSTVSVPDEKVGEVRVRLASAGVPSGGAVGYELFDKTTMGTTEFVQKLNYRRALEGELMRTIAGLSEVAAARVHIVIPEKHLFVEDEVPPTASIVVKLRPGAQLDKRKLTGIMQLVAASVEGLQPEHVTVLDYAGNLLSPMGAGDPEVALSARQLDLQKSVEAYLQTKAQSLLDGVVGPGKSIVRVNAELNFEKVDKTVEQYDPDNLAMVSQEQNEETSSDNATTAEGGGSGGKTTKTNTITNYETNKTVQHIIAQTGNIERLSVSVIVDGKPGAKPAGEAETPEFTPRSTEELDRLSSVVKNALGYSADRKDDFQIVSVLFDREDFKEEQKQLDKLDKRQLVFDVGKKVLQVLAILAALFVLRRIVKKALAAIKNWVPPSPPRPVRAAVPTIEEEPMELIVPEKRKAKLTDQMSQVAKERPAEIARVIRTLMIE